MIEENNEISVCTVKARDLGGSIIVTIDSNVVQYEGIEKGDLLRVWVKKLPKKVE